MTEPLACRPGCAACCIAPSISSPIPGMPGGKPAGVPCCQLDDALRCRLFGRPERPAVCSGLRPDGEMCGTDREGALACVEHNYSKSNGIRLLSRMLDYLDIVHLSEE